MRRIATALVLLAAATQGAQAAVAPTLRVVTFSPLVVRGTHFRATERVTVHAANATRVVRTNANGAFSVSFAASIDRCSARIFAVGAAGERAVLPLRPMCAPASTP